MRKFVALLIALPVIACAVSAQSALDQAKPKLETLITASGAETVSVAVYDTRSKQTLRINDKVSLHDAGIVYPPKRKPYIIVVLTRGLTDEKRAHQLVAAISQAVYQALQ